MEILLAFIFFLVAILYSSVGLGGGSSYTALLAIFGINYKMIPTTSLLLNMVVTFIALITFWRNGYLRINLILPFLVTSVPMSYLGGAVHIPREIFYPLLMITLVLVVIRIYLWNNLKLHLSLTVRSQLIFSLALGSILGFIAGAVGIGGGVYLVPLIIMFGLGSEKEAASAGTLFIFVNSLAGISARFQRGVYDFEFMLPLIGAVILGGFLGSHLGAAKFKPVTVQKTMGIVIIIAIGFLLRNSI